MTLVFADTEDNSKELLARNKSGFDKRITLICALTSDGKDYTSKGDVAGFLRWLRSCGKTRVYFHNLRYDMGNLFGRALDLPKFTLVGNRLIRAEWGGMVFHDTYNLWPASIKRIGEAVGLKKLKFDASSVDYCFRDVEIMQSAHKLISGIAGVFGIETVPSTIASLAVKIWRAMGGKNWFCDHASAKEAFYGGRVELFRPSCHSGHISYCDVNSLYPACMTREYPVALEPQKDLNCEGIAYATIEIPKETYVAPLPVRRKDASIFYPTGRIAGVWTTGELRRAVAYGTRVLRLHQVFGTRETTTPYKGFVEHFYCQRQLSKSSAERTYYKLLMNNLYGQLGMSGEIGMSVYDNPEDLREGVVYGMRKMVKVKMPLPEHVNYLHAAMVTSYARQTLHEHLCKVVPERLIYCDTDSIILDGKPPFPVSSNLGEFKLEKVWKHCHCIAPKVYQGKAKGTALESKAKGVPQRLAAKFIQDGHVEYETPYGLREAIAGYNNNNHKQLSVWHWAEKELRTQYDKKKLVDGRFWPLVVS